MPTIKAEIAGLTTPGPIFKVSTECRKCGGFERYKNGKCRPCHTARIRKKWKEDPEYRAKSELRRG